MINKDYHVHTNFVDGKDDAEEVVLQAIKSGISEIGFTEHAHVPFDPVCSMSEENTVLYRKKIHDLKEKYAEKITVLCGIEMDYYSLDRPENYDYVIGSIHYLKVKGEVFLIDFSPKNTIECIDKAFGGKKEDFLKCYYEKVASLKEKTDADIIGHLDVITKFENRGVSFNEEYPPADSYWKSAVDSLCGKCVFEVNTGGISRGYKFYPYPDKNKLEYIYSAGGRVVLTSDSHSKNTLLYDFEKTSQLLKTVGFADFGFTDRKGKFHIQ